MPNNFVDHKDRWLLISRGDFDYSLLFIKAWLPFNAWYCNTYPDKNNKDRPILEEIKTDNNLFRTRLVSLLEGEDDESYFFRKNLVLLHNLLERCKVPDLQKQISFRKINFRINPNNIFLKNFRGFTFKIELITPVPPNNYRIKIDIIDSGNRNVFLYHHTKYDKIHLKNDSNFKSLSTKNQDIILKGFDYINPVYKEDLVVQKKSESYKKIHEVLFINDTNILSQAIIEILYSLRCILFHGEIQPSKDNLKIYEPSYYMLNLLLKSLY